MADDAQDLAALQESFVALQQGYAALHQELYALKVQMAEKDGERALSQMLLPEDSSLGDALSYSWVIGCGALVFIMQAGFALVEAGTCRAKNCLSILSKNQVDFVAASLAWLLFGWGLAFGDAERTGGIVGTSQFVGGAVYDGTKVSDDALNFYFQQMFCAVASTIVSGGIAERATLKGYVIFSFVMSSCIYPVVVCWCWNPDGWLSSRGFVDFAGSGVVHVTGGMGALAGAWILGPRAGRFGARATQDSHEFNPHSVPLIALGTMILQFGWYGFNAGSTLGMQSGSDARTAALACINTTVSAAAAAVVATAVWLVQHRRWDVPQVCNGVLAGCVSITAGCASVDPWSAIMIGAFGGVLFVLAGRALEHFHIDDPVGAFPVHGACGVWGVLATSLFHTGFDVLGEPSPGPGFRVQLLGVAAITTFSGISCLCVFVVVRRVGALEYSASDQRKGLDRKFTQAAYSTGEVTEFIAFISHAKGTHGACARWLQLELAAYVGGKSRIFLDSDNLVNLNHLLATVREKVECLVVLATEDIWWRPWCAGEIAVATQSQVPIVLVMMGEGDRALNLDFTQIASLVKLKIAPEAMEVLRPFGLSYEDIEHAYSKLVTYPQVNFGVFGQKDTKQAISKIAGLAGLKEMTAGGGTLKSLQARAEKIALSWRHMHRSTTITTDWWHAPNMMPHCLILCDTQDIEAVAASHICEKALVQAAEQDSASFKVASCAGVAEARVLQLVSAGVAVILILSKEVLSCPLVQRACLVRAAALWPGGLVGSHAEGTSAIPVAVNPELGFEFPTPDFYENLKENHPHIHREPAPAPDHSNLLFTSGRSLAFAWDVIDMPYPSDERAAMALVDFFKLTFHQIASPLSTHRSWKAIEQQSHWIYERASAAKRTPAANDKVSRKGTGASVHQSNSDHSSQHSRRVTSSEAAGAETASDIQDVCRKDADVEAGVMSARPSDTRRTFCL